MFAENRPDRYGWMLKYYDEMYTVLDLLLESYYLKKYCKFDGNMQLPGAYLDVYTIMHVNTTWSHKYRVSNFFI